VHQGAALHAGEDRLVHGLSEIRLRHDGPAPGAPEGLVGGGGREVRDTEQVWGGRRLRPALRYGRYLPCSRSPRCRRS
jgi:hypothetical protein